MQFDIVFYFANRLWPSPLKDVAFEIKGVSALYTNTEMRKYNDELELPNQH